jgi:tryptophanyl-tRNA synthetase
MTEIKKKERVLSGVQPSAAQVHLGNYLGAMKRFVSLSRESETLFCVVDLHALNTVEVGEQLRANTLSLTAAYLAIGLDPSRSIIFRQSDREHAEICWYLSTQFPLGLLERATKLKESRAKGINVNAGVMFYPVLMAADILLYDTTKVPVGPDQKQHLEMCREIAQKFNNLYQTAVFVVPEPLIQEDVGLIPGLDGRKMSKSYDNFIGLFEDDKSLKEKVQRIQTDSKGLADRKDPETCNVFALYKLLATSDEAAEMAEKYRSGGYGYGHAKQELIRVYSREFSPMRERYQQLLSRPNDLRDVLRDGARRAKTISDPVLDRVRNILGIGERLN